MSWYLWVFVMLFLLLNLDGWQTYLWLAFLTIDSNVCSRDILSELEKGEIIVDIDDDHVDPQLCASFACDIYKHLRASEAKKRPSTNFMEKIHKDINPSMRAILIDWLVESETRKKLPFILVFNLQIDVDIGSSSVARSVVGIVYKSSR